MLLPWMVGRCRPGVLGVVRPWTVWSRVVTRRFRWRFLVRLDSTLCYLYTSRFFFSRKRGSLQPAHRHTAHIFAAHTSEVDSIPSEMDNASIQHPLNGYTVTLIILTWL